MVVLYPRVQTARLPIISNPPHLMSSSHIHAQSDNARHRISLGFASSLHVDLLHVVLTVTIQHTTQAVRVPIPESPSALTPTWGAKGTACWPIGRQLLCR